MAGAREVRPAGASGGASPDRRSMGPFLAAVAVLVLGLIAFVGTRAITRGEPTGCEQRYSAWVRDARLLVTGTLKPDQVSRVQTRTPCATDGGGQPAQLTVTLKDPTRCAAAAADMTARIRDPERRLFTGFPGTRAACTGGRLVVTGPAPR